MTRPSWMAMTMTTVHLLLPDDLHRALRAEAERQKRSANQVLREALEAWLEARRRKILQDAIRGYAEAMAGTPFDLDPDLEAAATKALLADDAGS